jgi:Oxidoreductase family, NAD-binding Rossmann fold
MGALSDRLLVGILGAGRMAQGFDDPHSPHVLSLAHAVQASRGFRLGGFFDQRPERAEAAERRWSCPPSPRARAEWLSQPWDVVLIATPDAEHGADLRDVLARKPKGIVVEKPVATDGAEGLRLLEEAERLGVPVLVDFPRRWHSGVAAAARHIAAGRLGMPIAAALTYSGDGAHSAVHMLDLFHTWWGPGWTPTLVSRAGDVALVTLRHGHDALTASFVNVPADCYYVWEMHVWCERGKIELSRSPEVLEVSGLDGHPLYSSFQVLTPRECFPMEHEPVLVRLMDTLAGAIADPDAARALLRREMDSQAFSAEVLRCLETPESAARSSR